MAFRFRRSARLGPLRFNDRHHGGLAGHRPELERGKHARSACGEERSLGARPAGLLALIETPEALKGYLLRAQGQDDAKRRVGERPGLAGCCQPSRLIGTHFKILYPLGFHGFFC